MSQPKNPHQVAAKLAELDERLSRLEDGIYGVPADDNPEQGEALVPHYWANEGMESPNTPPNPPASGSVNG